MRIDFEDGVYIATIAFEQRHVFKQERWEWDDGRKRWTTRDTKKVLPFKDFTVGPARDALQRYFEAELAKVADSLAEDADIDIPVPEGINPLTRKPYAALGFQKAAVAYAASRKYTLIADQPGLGKTIDAILVSNHDPQIKNVLILCPAYLKKHWARTWESWDTKKMSIGICGSRNKTKTVNGVITRWIEKPWPDTQVVIINPEQLPSYDDYIKSIEWDLLVIDEAQYYCNDKTIRSKYLYGGKIKSKKDRTNSSEERALANGDATAWLAN